MPSEASAKRLRNLNWQGWPKLVLMLLARSETAFAQPYIEREIRSPLEGIGDHRFKCVTCESVFDL